MNFVQQLEECLRDLAAEARKRHPGVKEASERATLKLRHLKTSYVSAVRRANSNNPGKGVTGSTAAGAAAAVAVPQKQKQQHQESSRSHPTTRLFQSSEILHPFLLAANYPNASAKLLEISFRAMRLLLEADAVVPADGIHLVRVWTIQAQVVVAYYQRHYAKELAFQQQQEETSNHKVALECALTDDNNGGKTSTASTSTTASSWFGWATSSSAAVPSLSEGSTKAVKNAVSSSTGQAGQSSQSPKEMDKRAMDILSSLLQLLERLRQYYPTDPNPLFAGGGMDAAQIQQQHSKFVSTFTELWINAVALGCLWLNCLPARHTVQQAAHSTISQILTLLYHQQSATPKDNALHTLQRNTWQDLLLLSSSASATTTASGNAAKLTGAFILCKPRLASSTSTNPVPVPPQPTLAVELMTRLWRDATTTTASTATTAAAVASSALHPLPDALHTKTLHVTANLLDQVVRRASVERAHRILQWSTLLLQTRDAAAATDGGGDGSHVDECRELLGRHVTQPVAAASEACRRQHDFEDGYVYTHNEAALWAAAWKEAGGGGSGGEAAASAVAQSLLRAGGGSSGGSSSATVASHAATSPLVSLVPKPILWKAGLALEAIYRIMEGDPGDFMPLLTDRLTLGALAEALSDFATIGASCSSHMLQLVAFCPQSASASASASQEDAKAQQQATLVNKADQAIASGLALTVFTDEGNGKITDHRKLASGMGSGGASVSSTLSASLILGEALWTALQGVLRIAEALQKSAPDGGHVATDLLDETFAPSLAVLQHYLKRFVGSGYLVQMALKGYSHLAHLCLPSPQSALQQKALLTSLCKLSLPSWGKHDASCQLQDHHVRCLLCLIRIIHTHYECIKAEWEIVLWTFEELSVMAVASPLLSDEAYHGALAISTVFGRFAAFTTCFSIESLLSMVEALTLIVKDSMEDRDVFGDSDTILPERYVSTMGNEGSADSRQSESISKQIMNIGVRAIYGSNQSSGNVGTAALNDAGLSAERTKLSFYEEYCRELTDRISESKSTVRIASVGRLSFALALLADVAMANSFRYNNCGERMSGLLADLAASSPPVRPFVMDTIAMLTTTHISGQGENASSATFVGPGKVVITDPTHSQLLVVEPARIGLSSQPVKTEGSVQQAEVLAPLCESIRTTGEADVAEAALGTLHSVLETAGHNLTGDVWTVVIDAITSLTGDPDYKFDRSTTKWSKCCLTAFRCLKLIVDDFLPQLPKAKENTARTSLLDCCSSFGCSRHDVNTSLTAIGLLWTIADQDSGTDSIDRALAKLVLLSSDDRAEVRNAAVNTLFSCIVGRGSSFSPARWESCVTETVFTVYKEVSFRAKAGNGAESSENATSHDDGGSSRYKVSLHHSRDSSNKLWVTTQVVVLRGLTRVLRNFFPKLLDTTDAIRDTDTLSNDSEEPPWFQDAWVQILDYAFEAATVTGDRETLDIRSAGVELLVICSQLSSRAGIHAAIVPARVSTNMEVVNGALRSVREVKSVPTGDTYRRSHSKVTEASRQNLFLEAFECMESFDDFLMKSWTSKLEDTQLQILHKFCTGLAQVYECCRDNELSANNRSKSLDILKCSIEGTSRPLVEEHLDRRFASMVAGSLRLATIEASRRFLNQAQRASLELLKLMAAEGSCEAFLHLLNFTGKTLCSRLDGEKDDPAVAEQQTDGYGLVAQESSAAVSKGVHSEEVADECCLLVFHEVLLIISSELSSENDTVVNQDIPEKRPKPYYKRAVPIIARGLHGTSALLKGVGPGSDIDKRTVELVDAVWAKFCTSLSQMLAPIPIGRKLERIPGILDMLEIIETAARNNVSKRHKKELCTVLGFGASKCIEVAHIHEEYANANSEEVIPLSKNHPEVMKLFFVCFSSVCALCPEDTVLQTIANQILGEASTALSSNPPVSANTAVEASLLICTAITENQEMDTLVISVFPMLFQLITSDHVKLRQAVVEVFQHVKVGVFLQSAKDRYVQAEDRANKAEEKVQTLKLAISDLQKKNESLNKDLAVLEASSRM